MFVLCGCLLLIERQQPCDAEGSGRTVNAMPRLGPKRRQIAVDVTGIKMALAKLG